MKHADRAENVLLAELRWWWHHLAMGSFDALKPPTLVLDDSDAILGRWQPATRTIALSRSLVMQAPWTQVVEVLRHEIAHQYVHEVLGVTDEAPHGPTFRRVCRKRGIDPAARGLPAEQRPVEVPAAVAKAQKLLALAESANRHEAAAAAAAAHRLMRRYQLEAADLRGDAFSVRTVLPVHSRIPNHASLLAGLLGQHFFVQPVWVVGYDRERQVRGRVLELAGRPAHLDVAAYVHDFVLRAAERLWAERRRELGVGNKGRRRFLSGVMQGFAEQLRTTARQCEETGLVVVQVEPALQAFVQQRHRTLRTRRTGAGNVDADWHAGRAQGRRLHVREGVTEGVGPRLLTKR